VFCVAGGVVSVGVEAELEKTADELKRMEVA